MGVRCTHSACRLCNGVALESLGDRCALAAGVPSEVVERARSVKASLIRNAVPLAIETSDVVHTRNTAEAAFNVFLQLDGDGDADEASNLRLVHALLRCLDP